MIYVSLRLRGTLPRGLNPRPGRRANPSKPNAVNAIGMNNMSKIVRIQIHGVYPQSYQLITVILGPISGKHGWKRRTKLTCYLESTRCKIGPGTDRLRIAGKANRGNHWQVSVCTQLRQLTGWSGRAKRVGALDSTDRKKVIGAYDRGLAANQCLPRAPWRLAPGRDSD